MGLTDYLEEHLGNAEALLERIRQLEQSASGLSGKAVQTENAEKYDDFTRKTQDADEKSEIVSEKEQEVYNIAPEVNQLKKSVDNLDVDLEIRGKEEDIAVNRQAIADDNGKNLEQAETVPKVGETGGRNNAERAENRSPLSDQLEELDRATSALTALVPEGQGGAQSPYPISLSPPQAPAADPTTAGAPGEVWSVPGIPSGSDLTYGGTQNWAEQTDRLFRRDSRRYDGGFYLY